jgi:hypothetical protein
VTQAPGRRPPETAGGEAPLRVGPIVAPPSGSAAEASRPDVVLEDGRFHIYDANPAPWWVAVLWLAFFVFAVTYLLTNLIE